MALLYAFPQLKLIHHLLGQIRHEYATLVTYTHTLTLRLLKGLCVFLWTFSPLSVHRQTRASSLHCYAESAALCHCLCNDLKNVSVFANVFLNIYILQEQLLDTKSARTRHGLVETKWNKFGTENLYRS